METKLRALTKQVGDLVEVFRANPPSGHDKSMQEYQIEQSQSMEELKAVEKRAAESRRNRQEIVSIPLLGSSVFLILVSNFEILNRIYTIV